MLPFSFLMSLLELLIRPLLLARPRLPLYRFPSYSKGYHALLSSDFGRATNAKEVPSPSSKCYIIISGLLSALIPLARITLFIE
jgi:hypothetical protein